MNTNRERLNAIFHYENYDRMPIVHFGFWRDTLWKWVKEGHLTSEEVQRHIDLQSYKFDGNVGEDAIARKLGFCDNIINYTGQKSGWYDVPLFPLFEEKIIEQKEDGQFVKLDQDGVFVTGTVGVTTIPGEIGYTLKDRESWEKYYLPKMQWTEERLDMEELEKMVEENDTREKFTCVYCGSLYGKLRNFWGITELSYVQVDDPDLFKECIDVIGDLSYQIVKHTLATGVKLDFAHYWEDISYNRGSLVNPKVFREFVGKHYRRISDECNKHGIDIICVDSDGLVDDLVPVWLDNGVNTMLPLEVGSWEYDFSAMRKKFGKEVRGIGNMDKQCLLKDKKAVDHQVERAKRLVDLGGYVPCFDHRIAPEAEWDLVKYYCERMKEELWK